MHFTLFSCTQNAISIFYINLNLIAFYTFNKDNLFNTPQKKKFYTPKDMKQI